MLTVALFSGVRPRNQDTGMERVAFLLCPQNEGHKVSVWSPIEALSDERKNFPWADGNMNEKFGWVKLFGGHKQTQLNMFTILNAPSWRFQQSTNNRLGRSVEC